VSDGDCRVTESVYCGWRSVVLENEHVQVVVLPDKGAELQCLIDRRSGVDLLFKGPWGLRPPGAPRLEGSAEDDPFMWNYAGGWQDLFPSVDEPCTYRGRAIPFHGEVAILPWEQETLADGGRESAVRFSTRTRAAPFRLERVLRLRAGEAAVAIEETVVNESAEPAHFVWGQHCVVGPPFLEAGCRLEIPARAIVTSPRLWEPETARLEPSQRSPWPRAALRSGGTVDLREVPGPEAGSHDDLYVTELEAGWLAIENSRLDLAFRLEWDRDVFPWIVLWQPYGGAAAPPLTGSYALGVEPWMTMYNLERSVEAGTARALAAHDTFSTSLEAHLMS
jgi:galactose mutarotase-like enzyme